MSEMERRALLGVAGVAGLAALAKAGPINPPAGAVAPTGKSLQEIADKVARTDAGLAEARTPISTSTTPGNIATQFRITQPGSYYLTGNISVSGLNAIEIVSARVTLDLNGFTITGNGAAGTIGITAGTGASALVVRNGRVTGFGGSGISLTGESCVVQDVHSTNNVGSGIALTNNAGRVDRCHGSDNGGSGIVVGPAGNVVASLALRNGVNGIVLGSHAVATACTSSLNTGDGFSGSGACIGCTSTNNGDDGFASCVLIESCYAFSNDGDGFTLCDVIHRSVANSNTGNGAGAAGLVTDSFFELNSGGGVSLNTAGAIHRCVLSSNGSASTTANITAASRCTVAHNTVSYGGNGIVASNQSIVEHNCVFSSGTTTNICNGIDVTIGVVIRNNMVSSASGAGYEYGGGCIVVGNGADGSTGGAFVTSSGTPFVGPIISSAANMATAGAQANFSV
jgi:hypothetical protein